MDIFTSFRICSSGLTAQRAKMDVIASNLANVETTRTPEGGPYKKKTVILAAEPMADVFGSALKAAVRAVKVDSVAEDKEVKMMYEPAQPDADDKGYVAKPNVNPITEMAARAGITVVESRFVPIS